MQYFTKKGALALFILGIIFSTCIWLFAGACNSPDTSNLDVYVDGPEFVGVGSTNTYKLITNTIHLDEVADDGDYIWTWPAGFTLEPGTDGSNQTIKLIAPATINEDEDEDEDADEELKISCKIENDDWKGDCVATQNVTVVQVDILKVPEFLFASAKYWTPIKFKILPSEISLAEENPFTSITATLHYKDGEKIKIEGLEQYCKKDEDEQGVYECYINPEEYNAINLGENHYVENAYFSLKVEFSDEDENAGSAKSDLEDEDAKISKRFVDKTIFAVDMTEGPESRYVFRGEYPDAFKDVYPKMRWEMTHRPLLWEEEQAPFENYTHYKKGSFDVTGTYFNNLPYWDTPNFPKWEFSYNNSYILPNTIIHGDCFEESWFHVDLGNTSTLLSKVKIKQNSSNDTFGVYVGKNLGLRSGAYYFISYGGKEVAGLPEGKYAMDLDANQGDGFLDLYNGAAEIVTYAPSSENSLDMLITATLSLGWALAPSGGFSVILGSIASIYPVISAANTRCDKGKSNASIKGWYGFSKEGDIAQKYEPGSTTLFPINGAVLRANFQNGEVLREEFQIMSRYPLDPKPVGTMVFVFVEVNTTSMLRATDTYFGWGVDSASAEAKYITSENDLNKYRYSCRVVR